MGLRWDPVSKERERDIYGIVEISKVLAYRHIVLCCEKCFSSLRRGEKGSREDFSGLCVGKSYLA